MVVVLSFVFGRGCLGGCREMKRWLPFVAVVAETGAVGKAEMAHTTDGNQDPLLGLPGTSFALRTDEPGSACSLRRVNLAGSPFV